MTYPPDPNQPPSGQPDPNQPPSFEKQPPPPSYPPAPGAGQPYPPGPGAGQPYQPAPPPMPGYGYGEGGNVPAGMWFDPQTGLTLPNGVQLASHGRRVGAFFLAIPLAIVTLIIGYWIWGIVLWRRGTSPALKVLGMKAWKIDQNQKATFGTMVLRDVVGTICERIISVLAVVSFILFLAIRQRRTIPDYVGGTVIVHDPNNVLG